MKVVEIYWRQYSIALAKPLRMRGHEIQNRKGYYIQLVSADHNAFFEFCPLQEIYPSVFLKECQKVVIAIKKIEFSHEQKVFLKQLSKLPASKVLFTFQVALLNLFYKHTNIDIFSVVRKKININALIVGKNITDEVARAVALGFDKIKIKVAADSLTNEMEALKKISHNWPNVKLRLDANKLWSLKDALKFLQTVDHKNIDYIEEPLINIADVHLLPKEYRIALDESLVESKLPNFDVMVIKPMQCKSLSQLFAMLEYAKEHSKEVVISSIFESPLAFHFLCRLALSLNTASSHHGLAPYLWFNREIFSYIRTPAEIFAIDIEGYQFVDEKEYHPLFLIS